MPRTYIARRHVTDNKPIDAFYSQVLRVTRSSFTLFRKNTVWSAQHVSRLLDLRDFEHRYLGQSSELLRLLDGMHNIEMLF